MVAGALCLTAPATADVQTRAPLKPLSREVRNACEAAYKLATKIPGVAVKRRIGTFHDEALPVPVSGCGLAISGSFSRAAGGGDAALRLREDFAARGWNEMPAYGADGKDGTSFAFRDGAVACLVRGTWDGGSDDEPGLPAADWYKVVVICSSPPFPAVAGG